MDVDGSAPTHASELPDEAKRAFKDWVKSDLPPHELWRATDWFARRNLMAAADGHEQLVKEALEEAAESFAERQERFKALQVPGLGLPLTHMPPAGERFPVLLGVEAWDWKAATLLTREVCMMRVVEELSNKEQWWLKVHDPATAQRWRDEALAMDWEAYRRHADFTPAMADACISELQKKAELYQKTGLMPIFDYSSCVIKSDSLVPQELRDTLRTAVSRLEDVPDREKDWHPGTSRKVLDLVHPSLWPLIYGRSRVLPSKRMGVAEALEHCGTGDVVPKPTLHEAPAPGEDGDEGIPSVSDKFQWLPCEVALNGSSATIDSYINNLHPERHAELYPLIGRFIEKALPAWDVIYRWPREYATQRLVHKGALCSCKVDGGCGWECQPWSRPLDEDEEADPDAQYRPGYEQTERFKRDWAWYTRTHPMDLVDAVPGGAHHLRLSPADVRTKGFFNGASRIQVIVKLANIHLTPEDPEYAFEVSEELANWYTTEQPAEDQGSNASSFHPSPSEGSPSNSDVSSIGDRPLSMTLPDLEGPGLDNDPGEYEGGTWHTEGMLNERICATALFYYDSQNVTDCELEFRAPANREDLSVNLNYGQHQHYPIARAFAIPNVHRDTMQPLGGVRTTNCPSTGDGDTRAVFFPNLLQHRVAPFRLADPSRPGHRKLLALFLVDPAVPVASTASVPPQQRDWWACEGPLGHELARRLPAELTRMVLDDVAGFPISTQDAKEVRLQLMEERSVRQDKTEERVLSVGWNFCEH